MATELTLEELRDLSGERDLGVSEWHRIEQKHIDLFADATGDHQWIHVNPEMAAQGPFGTTIAHGYLTLSLLPMLMSQVMTVVGARMGVNYGTDKIRFTNAVPSGSNVRLKARLLESQPKGDGTLYKVGVEIEIEGNDKPALVGEVLYLVY
ncbi:MAG TPA: MaoC family dehydratase [Actinomycetota bacterium]|nr:MaoC family dehydratase [Actinomycetota bacterium]